MTVKLFEGLGGGTLSDDATLTSLEFSVTRGEDVELVTLTPAFASNTTEYTAAVGHRFSDASVHDIVKGDSGASVVVTDKFASYTLDSTEDSADDLELAVGENTITVTVTAADGNTTETYTLVVTRAAPPPPPAHCETGDIWCATLTVAGLSDGEYGYSGAQGALSHIDFEHDGTVYKVDALYNSDFGLRIEFSPTGETVFNTDDLFLDFDGTAFAFSDATFTSSYFAWADSGLLWSLADTVEVRLFERSGTAATGQPTISGTARVGQTLTADTSGIADADGLTSVSYSYQWIRVLDTVETEISGATSSTYMLVADDVGKTIRVKVTFTDDADNPETAISDAFPSSGTVEVALSDDATLSALALKNAADDSTVDLNETFAPATTTYTADVAYTVTSITIEPTTSDSNATVAYLRTLGGPLADADVNKPGFQVDLPVTGLAKNTVKVQVTAEDGNTTETYTLLVGRASASTDATLSALALKNAADDSAVDLNETFAPATTTYTADVAYTVTSITIEPTTSDSNATVAYLRTLGGPLADADVNKPGFQVDLPVTGLAKNTVKVQVTAEDGNTTETYTLLVGRASASTDATLSALALADNNGAAVSLTPSPFVSTTKDYTADVANGVTSITLTPTLNDSNATVEYLNASDAAITDTDATTPALDAPVVVGDNTVKVKVTAEAGDPHTDTYTVVVTRRAVTTTPPAPPEIAVPNDWSLIPTGLGAGDKFRLLFLSSTKTDGESYDIADYNTFIQGRAAAGHTDIQAYSSGFRALGCTPDSDATANTGTTGTGVVIHWLNGNKVADDYADFYNGNWDEESNSQDKNELGTNGPNTSQSVNYPFTGCDDDGTEDVDGGTSYALGEAQVRVARPGSSAGNAGPLTSNSDTAKANTRPMYGLSQVFEVAAATASDDADLTGLALKNASDDSTIDLNETFASATKSYTADVLNAVDEITVEPAKSDSNATVAYLDASDTVLTDADGATGFQVALAEGENTIKVKVTAEDGNATETYTVVVTRPRRVTTTPAAPAEVTVPNDWSLIPAGLVAGDQFRLLFLSSTKTDGESYDIADYNTFIQGRAAAGHTDIRTYSSGFRAVGCTPDSDATANTGTTGTGVVIHWLNGNQVADDYADFYDGNWDEESNSQDKNELGTNGPNTSQSVNYPLTGCDDDGTEDVDGGTSYALGEAQVRVARPGSSAGNAGPLTSNSDTAKANTRPMYGLSQVFEVAAAGNTSASGAPVITGAAQVGKVLTAGIGTIADAEGLPGTFPDDYTLQWVRVDADGVSNETDIGTDSGTYTLVAADEGKKIKLKVGFTDDGGTAEERTSDAFPSSGTIAAAAGCAAGEIWCATLNVKALDGGNHFGCANSQSGKACSNSSTLTEDEFIHASTDYDVTSVQLRSNGQVQFWMNPDIATGSESLVLHIGSETFPFQSANTKQSNNRRWNNTGLSWSAGDAVALKLTEAVPVAAEVILPAPRLPSVDDPNAIWMATLTVANLGSNQYGYKGSQGGLTDTAFTYLGDDTPLSGGTYQEVGTLYTIDELSYHTGTGQLLLSLDGAFVGGSAANIFVDVGGTRRSFSQGTYSSVPHTYTFTFQIPPGRRATR